MTQDLLRIGTRGSPLALAQAHETRDRLREATGLPEAAFEIVVIRVTGDVIQDRSLREAGGKGLFTKEIEEALLSGEVDIAVHSMKDMPTEQPEGLALDCFLPREDTRDAFVTLTEHAGIADLPEGATVGTSSLRRRAQLLARRPDLKVVEFRGNVQTRLSKLSQGIAEATFLAMAGLNRLGYAEVPARPIPPDAMLPAIAQGAIGIERRSADDRVREMLAPIHHEPTGQRLAAERGFLRRLDGSCQTPIAGLAELDGDRLRLRGEILRPDGSRVLADDVTGAVAEGAEMGRAMAERLLGEAGPGFFG
ncbi:Porphobilinogen deaminase [Rubellimicrobium mesophilum DSM 19309]|uniref:Porphobilinogen deaminase n=1 Tax=Rubellimicrobium mesophilum DSM 19309 TaxID=442562 RepID=A0A017HJH8_9RHOB|nr:hydroxymethylbilane synthase [Rubellimicrobium mesophilum]EYD74496.1 Porphobilinogen deaminase [Rubellimicrobium mesophilum DSM 19309]